MGKGSKSQPHGEPTGLKVRAAPPGGCVGRQVTSGEADPRAGGIGRSPVPERRCPQTPAHLLALVDSGREEVSAGLRPNQ